jgi:hypothetical protein
MSSERKLLDKIESVTTELKVKAKFESDDRYIRVPMIIMDIVVDWVAASVVTDSLSYWYYEKFQRKDEVSLTLVKQAIGGDLKLAIKLMAVGEILGLWEVVTPKKRYGFEDWAQLQAVRRGQLWIKRLF